MMDRIEAMRVFVRVVETRSFSQAARDLGIPASTVTEAVQRIERRLGVRLIHRTTRVVAPTPDGEAWYALCLDLIASMEAAEAAFAGGVVEGRLHVNVHGTLARHFLMPHLPDFLARHPQLDLVLSEGDSLVDLVAAGVDCVVRVGKPADSDLIARRLGDLTEATIASPIYLDRHGIPTSPADLEKHRMIAFLSSVTGAPMPLEFTIGSEVVEMLIPVALTVSAADTLAAAMRAGLGLIQAPRYHFAEELARGSLIELLPANRPAPIPVYALYPSGRQLSPRVRAFLDWVMAIDFSGNGAA